MDSSTHFKYHSLYAVSGGLLYLGGNDGKVYVTVDSGQVWSLTEPQ